jgi:perosamine synthetase
MSKIYYTKPSITKREIDYVNDAVANGWGDQYYRYISRFEKMFAEYIGVKYAIATSSCTGALHLGLKALGIGPGDEVILADTNWVATMAPITYLGAEPVLVDILPDTWCIDPASVMKAISPRTKLIIATHLYGNLCDMDALWEISVDRKLPGVIEDAAEAIGSVYRGARAGSIGVFGTYSFHGTKTVSTGEGGMLVTDDEAFYESVLLLNNHGRRKISAKQFWPEKIGYKYKISNVQAAMGCAQMERIDELVARKRDIFEYYQDALSEYPEITMNPEPENTVNGYWMPNIVFDHDVKVTREILLDKLTAANIDTRVFFYPLSSLPFCQPKPQNKVAYDIPERAINLPSYHDITDEEQDRVIDVIRRVME